MCARFAIRRMNHAHSPRQSLGTQEPKDRAAEKALLACAWLAVFGHSTEHFLRAVLQVKTRGLCPRLRRAGLLLPVNVPMSNSRVWALTAAGVRLAESALQRRVTYLSHPERLTISRLAHDLAVQREALARLPTDLAGLRRLRADRELREIGAGARPDVMVRHIDNQGVVTTACLEVEISSKGEPELRAKMNQVLHLLTPRTLWIWVVTEGETVRLRYQRTWQSVVEEFGEMDPKSRERLLDGCIFQLPATVP